MEIRGGPENVDIDGALLARKRLWVRNGITEARNTFMQCKGSHFAQPQLPCLAVNSLLSASKARTKATGENRDAGMTALFYNENLHLPGIWSFPPPNMAHFIEMAAVAAFF